MFGANAEAEPLLESLGCSVLCLKNDGLLTVAYAGASFYRALGYEKTELAALGLPESAPVLSGESAVDWERVRAEIAEKGYSSPELRLIRKDGHHIWMVYRATYVEEGGAGYFRGVVSDITLERRSQRLKREQTAELQAITANVPCGVLRCCDDADLSMDFISEGFCILTGYRRWELAERFGNRYLLMVLEEDRGILMQQTDGGPRRSRETGLSYRLRCRDGRVLWVFDRTRITTDENGSSCLYCVLMDITSRKKAEEELAAGEERYRLILEHVADPICDFDFRTEEAYLSPAFLRKFGGGSQDSHCDMYRCIAQCLLVHIEDKREFSRRVSLLIKGNGVPDWETRLKQGDGRYVWCSIHPAVFYDGQGRITRIILFISDIDSRKRENIVLRQRAEHDLLTGLYNRMTTMALIDEALAKSEPSERHALFVMDIDNFKEVNDHLGHLAGDRLIVRTAAELRRQFRGEDVIGRVGGDEFVVFLRDVNLQTVLNKADMMLQACRKLDPTWQSSVKVSGSIGISLCPVDGKTYEELFRKADNAMYAAKNSGKNGFRIYMRGIETLAHNGGQY